MKVLQNFLEKKVEPLFKKGAPLAFFHPIFDMVDTIMFTPATVAKGTCHIRDGLEQKRMMISVVVALIAPMLVGIYNVGLQANRLIEVTANVALQGWRAQVINFFDVGFSSASTASNFLYGLLYFVPILLVVLVVGGICEVVFAVIRRHEVAEAFLVTSFLIVLTMPPDVPLWQVAVATVFGVVVGKEIFGGVGFNLLNPALTARAFLFFAYPASISGDTVWVALDGVTKATPLGLAAVAGVDGVGGVIDAGYTMRDAFFGFIPGSIGEVSTLACLLGAVILVGIGIGSWRVMVSVFLGMLATVLLFNVLAPLSGNPMLAMPPLWHFVLGGFAFGMVYMATDPVSGAMTWQGQFVYGALIGVLASLIRVVNPAYPEGMMLAILFMNVFAPLVDYYVVQKNIKRRRLGYVNRKVI